MTFEQWKQSQSVQVKRDLYEYVWVNQLCIEVWQASEANSQYYIDRLERELREWELCNGRNAQSE